MKRNMNLIRRLAWVFVILLISLQVSASGLHSMSLDSGKITLKAKSISIKEVLNLIEQKSTYRFLFNDDLLELNRTIDVDVKDADVDRFLKNLLAQNSAKAQFLENNLVVITRQQLTQNQQTRDVNGIVKDADNGEPLIGANVVIKGTTTGTITDINGAFSLSGVDPTTVLVISYIGYKNQEITVGAQISLLIKLQPDGASLNEVVVIGYGTLRKSDVTAAITSVKPEELMVRATTNPAEALQGRVAGVNIQKFGGNAGAGVYVKIRGVNTSGSNEPLYIIDGFPGNIANVNPADIESMDILKDGAAAAIYGSVAANGVIIVTTRKGKAGDVKVDVNSYMSMTQTAKTFDLLDADGYRKVHRQMYENAGEALPAYISNASAINTNWQDQVFRNGMAYNHSIGLRGGSEKLTFALSANVADEKGIMIDNSYKQENARMKLNFKKSIFDVDAQIAFASTKSKQPNFSLKEVYMISPLVPVFDSNEKYGYGLTNKDGLPNNVNPVAQEHFVTSWSKGQDVTANFSVAANFTKWLQYKTSYSYRGKNTQAYYHRPTFIADPKVPNEYPYYQEKRTYYESQVIDNILSFNKKFDNHSVNVMLGNSVQKDQTNWNTAAVEGKTTVYSVQDGKLVASEKPGGFLDEYFMTLNAGRGGTFSADGSRYEYNRVSLFGRVNYAYADRYLLQFTMRRDGSSKFGRDNRWGNFPSVALGWRLSEESFFPELNFVNNLKIRGSWGRLGNEAVLGYYDFQSLIESGNGLWYGYVQGVGANPWPGSIAPAFENRTLKWETTDSKNIGVDFTLFDNSVNGTLNFYQSNTVDLLVAKKLPESAGMYHPILNVGEFKNSGVEFEVNYSKSVGELQYNVGFNFSTLKNEVVKLAEEGQVIYGTGLKYGTEHFPTQTLVGRPVGSYFLYKTDGIFQNTSEVTAHKNKEGELLQPDAMPGDIRFKDVNGDGVIDPKDQVFCGSGMPKLEMNLSGGVSYKGFDFSLQLGSGWGHKLYNGNRYFYESMSSGSNMLASSLNAWSPGNTNTDVPRAVLGDPNGNARESDRFLEKGDFIRLRNIQLGYSLNKNIISKAGIERTRIYLSADNLYTWTNYSGIDPEFARSSVFNTGVDNLIYPFTRSFVVGLQLTF